VNPERYSVIAEEFPNGQNGVDQVRDEGEFLDRLFSLLNGARNATIAVALVQALAALLLISNTIQLAAFNRRNETNIMRLVGASRWYTQLPFILEAALAGLVGGLLAVGGLILTKLLFVDKTLAGPIKAGIITGIEWSSVATTGALITLGGVVAAGIASYVTLRLYVRL
jgi:cell division transport system permease protein